MCRIRQCEVYASLPGQPPNRDEKSQMREEQAVVLTCKSRAVSSGSEWKRWPARDTARKKKTHMDYDLFESLNGQE